MVRASSRLFSIVTNPISLLHHRPFSLLRLARRHSLIFPLTTLSAATNHLLNLPRPTLSIPIKFSQNFYSRATYSALQENNHIPTSDYHVPPSHPWPEWSRLLESLSVAGYFNGSSNIEDELVENENISMEFVAAANSCLAFARDRPDILRWLPRKDIDVLVDDGYPFLFKSAHETERRMKSFLQAEGLNEARSVDLMKYILSYASNPIIYPERNIKEATESAFRSLLQEIANLSHRGQTSEQFQGVGRDEQMPRNLGPNITMKRGDWICPKCSFMNFARNAKCLECEELRPQRQMTDGGWDCPRCTFFNYQRNVVCLKCECRRPDEASFPGSSWPAKAPFEKQLINSHYGNNYGDNRTPSGNNFRATNKNLETSTDHNSHQFLDRTLGVSGTYSKNSDRGQNDRRDGQSAITMGASGYVPYVPLPADMFAKKPEKTAYEHHDEAAVRRSELMKAGEDSQWSEKSTTYVQNRQTQDIDKEEKTERWFQKVKELHGVTEPTGGILHDDLPHIMPVRKGENKKDQPYSPNRRKQTMEQGSSSSFVPFVPFPPDYFAKKDNRQQPKTAENSNNVTPDKNPMQGTENQQMGGTGSFNTRSSIGNIGLVRGDANTDSSGNQFKREKTRPEISNVTQKTPEKMNVRSGWTGKSLEGSAVTETDPLDMSEEAKAERWFRRVAQIKDISELSEIPDEDFPSIMPMRKGVNRFVVSKRKTPLERRLTSPQYRKNLRIMSSESVRKEGDDDN